MTSYSLSVWCSKEIRAPLEAVGISINKVVVPGIFRTPPRSRPVDFGHHIDLSVKDVESGRFEDVIRKARSVAESTVLKDGNFYLVMSIMVGDEDATITSKIVRMLGEQDVSIYFYPAK